MRLLKLCLILSFALTVSSCSRDSRDVSADKVKKETAEAYDALESYAIQKKEEFQQQAQAALDSYEKKIHELKAAAEKASGEARKKYNEALAEWNTKKDELNRQLEELTTAGAESWADAERRIDASMEELKKLYEEAKSALT